MAEFENFGFYTIDADYLEYLNNKNSEVYYNASYRNAIKPFVGIIIDMTECKYFIPYDVYKRIVFNELSDERYQDLFEKKYAFCLTIKDKILTKAEKIYKHQKETQNIRRTYCDFSCCENAMREWLKNRKNET